MPLVYGWLRRHRHAPGKHRNRGPPGRTHTSTSRGQTITWVHTPHAKCHGCAAPYGPTVRQHGETINACLHRGRRHRRPGHCLCAAARGLPRHDPGARARPGSGRQRRQRRAAQLFLRAAAGRSRYLEDAAAAAAGKGLAAGPASARRSRPMGLGAALSGRLQCTRLHGRHAGAAEAGRRKPAGLREPAGAGVPELRIAHAGQAGAVRHTAGPGCRSPAGGPAIAPWRRQPAGGGCHRRRAPGARAGRLRGPHGGRRSHPQ